MLLARACERGALRAHRRLHIVAARTIAVGQWAENPLSRLQGGPQGRRRRAAHRGHRPHAVLEVEDAHVVERLLLRGAAEEQEDDVGSEADEIAADADVSEAFGDSDAPRLTGRPSQAGGLFRVQSWGFFS